MGLLDVLRGNPRREVIPVRVIKTKAPRKRRTALEIACDRRLLQLQTENPAMFDKLALKRAGLTSEGDGDDIDRAFAIVDRAQKLGKKLVGKDDEEEGGLKAMLKVFGEAVGHVAVAYVRQQQGATAPPSPSPGGVLALPPGQVAASPEGAASPQLEQMIDEFVRLTPAQAAEFLRSRHDQYSGQVITALVNTPDERIPELAGQLRTVAPRGAPLLAQRGEWLVQVAQSLRAAERGPMYGDSPL